MPRVPKKKPGYVEDFCRFCAKKDGKAPTQYMRFAQLFDEHWDNFAEKYNAAHAKKDAPAKKRAPNPEKLLDKALEKYSDALNSAPDESVAEELKQSFRDKMEQLPEPLR